MESFRHSLHPFWFTNLWFCFAQVFENVLPIMRMCERFWDCTTLNDTKWKNFRRGPEVAQQFFNLFRAEQGLFMHSSCHVKGEQLARESALEHASVYSYARVVCIYLHIFKDYDNDC